MTRRDAPPAVDAHRYLAAWLDRVAGFAADPSTIPRLVDPAGRALFRSITTQPIWLDELEDEQYERERDGFFAATGALAEALARLDAVDELVLLRLYIDRVGRSFIATKLKRLQRVTDRDEREDVIEAVEQLRIGTVLNLCSLLPAFEVASADVDSRVAQRFADAATYVELSGSAVGLLLCEIEARLAHIVQEPAHTRLVIARDDVRGHHADRVKRPLPTDRDYESLNLWRGPERRPVVSYGGKFVATVGPGAVVWNATGTHALQWRDGDLEFEVTCVDGADARRIAASRLRDGALERTGPAPGWWCSKAWPAMVEHVRTLQLGSRACIASVQVSPDGITSQTEIDALLASVTSAP